MAAGAGRRSIRPTLARRVRISLSLSDRRRGFAILPSSVQTLSVSIESSPHSAIAQLDSLPEDEPVAFDAEVEGAQESLILLRRGDEVRAWLNICPHAGRRLDWSPGKFLRSKDGLLVCAAHGASFELVEGGCVAGPCRGQALRSVSLRVEDGEVRIA